TTPAPHQIKSLGHVAEWLRNGLQNRVPRFNSGRGLHFIFQERSGDLEASKSAQYFALGTCWERAGATGARRPHNPTPILGSGVHRGSQDNVELEGKERWRSARRVQNVQHRR